MGGAVSAGENNDDLIDNLLEADYIKSPSVERVFRAVDRAHYLTTDFKENAYKDLAWKSGNLHLSAPCIYSEVMESLKLSRGLSFLNLGSGTGYLSTMAGLILGPYGINHGVEIHEDVIQYACEKLDEFWRKSSALDEYEFCKPRFVHGNCLNINSDERQYDRVYCGAACPDNHENYMKNLIKVGGVLVMPLNDQLLQITRTSETTWDVKSVLPVSFASLLNPEHNQMMEHVKLPDSEPNSLQDICRSTIRCILRRNVEQEHPNITTRHHKQKKVWKKRALRRFVVPIFEESDGDEFFSIPNDVGGNPRDLGRASLVYNFSDQGNGRMTTVIDWARSLGRHQCRWAHPYNQSPTQLANYVDTDLVGEEDQEEEDEEEKEIENESADGNDVTRHGKKIQKRVKFDSGIGEDIENGKGLSSDSEGEASMDLDSDSELSDIVSNTGIWASVREPEPSWHRKIRSITQAEESEEDSHVSTEDTNPISEEEEEFPPLHPDSYGNYMRCKIQALPLPIQLKHYLNLFRDL